MAGWVRLQWGLLSLVVACSGSKREFPADRGQAGSETGVTGGTSGSSGGATGGTDPGSAGMATVPCEVEGARQCSANVPQECHNGVWKSELECPMRCTGEGQCLCMESMRRCDADTPQVCQGGEWVSEEPCSGATKACTGAGVCAAFRLTQGGLDAFNQRPAEKPSFVLKHQSLSAAPRVCAAALCVTATVE
jgi:hypothetical protein